MLYNFVSEGFHKKKLCSRLSSSEVRLYTENGRFVFLSRPRPLVATFNVHFRLIRKRVVVFLLVLTELFSLDVTTEALRAKIDKKSAFSLQRGQTFQGAGVARHQPFFLSQN